MKHEGAGFDRSKSWWDRSWALRRSSRRTSIEALLGGATPQSLAWPRVEPSRQRVRGSRYCGAPTRNTALRSRTGARCCAQSARESWNSVPLSSVAVFEIVGRASNQSPEAPKRLGRIHGHPPRRRRWRIADLRDGNHITTLCRRSPCPSAHQITPHLEEVASKVGRLRLVLDNVS